MITVITRLYEDEPSAKGVRGRLFRLGFPKHMTSLISSADAPDLAGLQRKIEQALVPADTAVALAREVSFGASLVVVRATYKPLNAVRLANETFASSGALSLELTKDPVRVKAPFDHAPNILKDHPLFLTLPLAPEQVRPLASERLGLRLLSFPRRRDSVMRPPKHIFGEGLRRKRKPIALKTGQHMSSYFWPTPLISKKARPLSILPEGRHPLSRLMRLRTVSDDTQRHP
ncbi:MAG: hypothetical protein AAF222_05495 [Pseudomonadota bacterium]